MRKTDLFTFLVVMLLTSCDQQPRVIEGESVSEVPGQNHVQPEMPAGHEKMGPRGHTVVAEETLQAKQYTYVKVKENGETFWVAIPKGEVKIGETYYFEESLLEKNFKSREHNRVFETLYLVSDFRKAGEPAKAEPSDKSHESLTAAVAEKHINVSPAPGAIKISELVNNSAKYGGKMVKLTGKCVKVNAGIMDKNWIHLQDGSADKFDMTVTTNADVAVGEIVSLKGVITLNKDFGAGYTYDIIMENAVLEK
jgi:hypothetical protein